MDAITQLTELFKQFPGIGPRQAKRFVYFLLTQSPSYTDRLIKLIQGVKQTITLCASCYRYFPKKDRGESAAYGEKGALETLCPICLNPNRDRSALLIVSRDVDFETIERAGFFNGLYFVLGGAIPLLEKQPEGKIRLKELVSIIEKRATEKAKLTEKNEQMVHAPLKEIIFALNLTPEGENTEEYIRTLITPLSEKNGFKLSTLGRGLSTGLELEYSDSETIKNALKNRL